MFTLIRYLVFNITQRKKEKNILLLGLDSAGKSSLFYSLKHKFNVPPISYEMTPTVGQNFAKIESSTVMWSVWDVGGTSRFRHIWLDYLADTDMLLWVVDSCDKQRLAESVAEFKKVMEHPHMAHTPVCIVACKQDKDTPLNREEIIQAFELDIAAHFVWAVIPTSLPPKAFDQHKGISEILDWLGKRATDEESKRRLEWKRQYQARQKERLESGL